MDDNGKIRVKLGEFGDTERTANDHPEKMQEHYLIIKVEKTDDGFANDENGNVEGVGLKEKDGVGGGIDMHDTQVTEISIREKLELKLEIEADESMVVENGQPEDISNSQFEEDKVEESDNSAYICALCKQTFLGSDASKAHLDEHIIENGYDCMDCETHYTSDCLRAEHTLMVFEIVGDTLEGRLYRYITACQLLVKDDHSEKEHTQLDSLQNSFSVSTETDGSAVSRSPVQPADQVSASISIVTKGNPFHFEAATLKEKTNASNPLERPYICMICYKRFLNNLDLDNHLFIHRNMPSYVCPNCNLPFGQEKQLKLHLKQNEKSGCELHVCTFCDKVMKKQALMRTHMYIHTGKGSFECLHCKKKWKNKSILNRHMESHRSEKLYQCSVCNKRFSTANSLKVHMNIHTGERSYACSVCCKVYSEFRFLKVHMCSHTGEGKYICKICSKPYYSSSQLKLHMCKHTGERPYVCKICSETFLIKSSLIRHLYRHNGLKPHACITCGKNFVLKQDLSEHIKTHAVRSHVCKMCNRGFTTGAYLNRHMKQHRKRKEGEFKCEFCDLRFTGRLGLKRHRTVHREKAFDSSVKQIINDTSEENTDVARADINKISDADNDEASRLELDENTDHIK